MTEDVKKTERKSSRKRVPLGVRNVLTAPKKPGFVRRFVNNTPDRIQSFIDAGYEVVKEDIQVGDDKIGKTTGLGSVVNPSVGGGQKSILMEIPEDFYQEDQKAKSDKLRSVDNEMRRQSKTPGRDGLTGTVTIS